MTIGKRFRVVASFGLLLTLTACDKSGAPKDHSSESIQTEQNPARVVLKSVQINLADYETLLDGVWNSSGSPVTQGRLDEFTWGSAWVDEDCLVFSFIKADHPFLNTDKLVMFIMGVDGIYNTTNSLQFKITDEQNNQGVIIISFVTSTEIKVSAPAYIFKSGIAYDTSYYKVAGPGVNSTK